MLQVIQHKKITNRERGNSKTNLLKSQTLVCLPLLVSRVIIFLKWYCDVVCGFENVLWGNSLLELWKLSCWSLMWVLVRDI